MNGDGENLLPDEEKPRKRSAAFRALRWLLIAAFAGVSIYSAYSLIVYYWASHNAQESVGELKSVIAQATSRPSPTPRPPETDPPVYEVEEEFVWKIDEQYLPLLELNPDIAGWIKIDGTNIDYPVMQSGEDSPEFYLNHNFEKNWDMLGLPFLDSRCALTPNSDVMLIYGHNIRSKIMFHHLMDYESEDFWRDNQYIVFDTLYAQGIYRVFAAFPFNVAASDKNGFQFHRYVEFADEEEFDEQIENVSDAALYDTGIEPVYGDRLLVLATCEYSSWNSRFVVFAKEVEYIPTE